MHYGRYLLLDTVNKESYEYTVEDYPEVYIPNHMKHTSKVFWVFGATKDEYIKLRDAFIESAFNPPKQEEDLYTELSTISFRDFKKILKEGDDLNILTGGSVEWLDYKFKQYMTLDLK